MLQAKSEKFVKSVYIENDTRELFQDCHVVLLLHEDDGIVLQ